MNEPLEKIEIIEDSKKPKSKFSNTQPNQNFVIPKISSKDHKIPEETKETAKKDNEPKFGNFIISFGIVDAKKYIETEAKIDLLIEQIKKLE